MFNSYSYLKKQQDHFVQCQRLEKLKLAKLEHQSKLVLVLTGRTELNQKLKNKYQLRIIDFVKDQMTTEGQEIPKDGYRESQMDKKRYLMQSQHL